jgi:carboxypeptidase C (cathepsin A)
MLYIDQPVGTGFSYVTNPNGYVRSEQTLTEELYTALTSFYALFPSLLKNDFYVFGESYAGKYIPYLATYIHEQNTNSAPTIVPLKGIGTISISS